MISRRLTKTQKDEILDAYRSGDNTISLAEKYNCTTNTINRTVKTLLSDTEYKSLKKERSRINNKKGEFFDKQISEEKQKDIERSNSLISIKEKVNVKEQNVKENDISDTKESEKKSSLVQNNSDCFNGDFPSQSKIYNNSDNDKKNKDCDNNLKEIEPLITNFDFDIDQKKSDFKILNYESLPESVYMIVDKKVELDLQLISDLPEWGFLPENELKRNAILLFSNQRSAKRSCSRNQRVIKIPNTSIFKLSQSYLVSKGITRLILEDSIIALDN